MYRVLRLVLNKKQGSRKFGKQVLDLMALRGCERDLFSATATTTKNYVNIKAHADQQVLREHATIRKACSVN